MTVTSRVMGIETEYGISVPGHPRANPCSRRRQVVNGYATATHRRRTAAALGLRGGEPAARRPRVRPRPRAPPTRASSTDEDIGLANVILTNGARLYVDHAHPEYSTPEVTNPRDAVLWDKAGERVMARGARERAASVPGTAPIHLYKNNTDNKGASYGSHENYLMARATPFADIVRAPHAVLRLPPGRLRRRPGRHRPGRPRRTGFQLSQRADFFEVEVGLETTLKRPIINTRDEPHADPEKYRRLHVIIGDANLAEVSTYLKVGTTSLVLAMIEDGLLADNGSTSRRRAGRRRCARSRTTRRCGHLVTLRDGRRMTAVQLQMDYLEQARKYVEDRYGTDVDEQTADVLTRWERCSTRLDDDPMSLRRELDWVAKLRAAGGLPRARRAGLGRAQLQLVDLQYADVRAGQGPLQPAGRPGARCSASSTEEEVRRARIEPPEDTRAYFRGRCLGSTPTSGRRVVGLGHLRRRAATRCSGCPRSSRCAAPRRTRRPARPLCRTAEDLWTTQRRAVAPPGRAAAPSIGQATTARRTCRSRWAGPRRAPRPGSPTRRG